MNFSSANGASWETFRLATPPDEPDGVLGTDWFIFERGEPLVEGVWRLFDSHYTAGIGALMFGTDE